MKPETKNWLVLAEAFTEAAIGARPWQAPLESLARATGSRAGQLIAFAPTGAVASNVFTGLDPAIGDDYLERGRSDPSVNPRVRAALGGALLEAVAEEDFIAAAERARNTHYRDFARKWDIPWSTLAPVLREPDGVVVLAVFRSEHQGHISTEQKHAFQRLVPHVHGALKLERALERQGALLAAGLFESLSMAAFVCDASGIARAMTPAAETMVRNGEHLSLRGGALRPAVGADALGNAIAATVAPGRLGPPRSVLLRGRNDPLNTLVVDVFALPNRAVELPSSPRVLVVARGTKRRRAETAALLKAAYGLSDAETDVAIALADGDAIAAIAAARGVGIATVRSQVKSAFAKLGVGRRAELTAQLTALR